MTCATCIRFQARKRPPKAPPWWRSAFGFCRPRPDGPRPYWEAEHPTGDLMVAGSHGADCPAYKERKLR